MQDKVSTQCAKTNRSHSSTPALLVWEQPRQTSWWSYQPDVDCAASSINLGQNAGKDHGHQKCSRHGLPKTIKYNQSIKQLAYTSLPLSNPTAFKSAQHRWRGPEAWSFSWLLSPFCDDETLRQSLRWASRFWNRFITIACVRASVHVSVIMEAWDSGIHNDPDFLKVQPTNPPNERQLTLWSFYHLSSFSDRTLGIHAFFYSRLSICLIQKKQQWPVTELYPPVCCPK